MPPAVNEPGRKPQLGSMDAGPLVDRVAAHELIVVNSCFQVAANSIGSRSDRYPSLRQFCHLHSPIGRRGRSPFLNRSKAAFRASSQSSRCSAPTSSRPGATPSASSSRRASSFCSRSASPTCWRAARICIRRLSLRAREPLANRRSVFKHHDSTVRHSFAIGEAERPAPAFRQ